MDPVQAQNQRDLGTPANRLEGYSETRTTTTRQLEPQRPTQIAAGSSVAEGVCAIAAVVLAILGLAQVLPLWLLAIGTICLGVALVLAGGASAARLTDVVASVGEDGARDVEVGTGMSLEILGGIGTIVLGILALIGIVPVILSAVAAIVFGGTLILGSASSMPLGWLQSNSGRCSSATRMVLREIVSAARGIEALAGIAGVVLGILALTTQYPVTLSLVALLVMSSAVTLTGAAVGGRMMALLQRRS